MSLKDPPKEHDAESEDLEDLVIYLWRKTKVSCLLIVCPYLFLVLTFDFSLSRCTVVIARSFQARSQLLQSTSRNVQRR